MTFSLSQAFDARNQAKLTGKTDSPELKSLPPYNKVLHRRQSKCKFKKLFTALPALI